jgi:amidase
MWPRFESEHELMAAGIYRPLDDALRIAYTELVTWIRTDYGLSKLDAYQLLSQVGKVQVVTEMVGPNYVVIASTDKNFLPPKKEIIIYPKAGPDSNRAVKTQ